MERDSTLLKLNELSRERLLELRAEIMEELDRRSGLMAEDDEMCVHRFICEHVGKMPPMRVLKHYKQLRENVAWLAEFIQEEFNPQRRNERLKIFKLAVDLSARAISLAGGRVCHRGITLKLRYFADTLDRQFPGYRQSGMLALIVDAEMM